MEYVILGTQTRSAHWSFVEMVECLYACLLQDPVIDLAKIQVETCYKEVVMSSYRLDCRNGLVLRGTKTCIYLLDIFLQFAPEEAAVMARLANATKPLGAASFPSKVEKAPFEVPKVSTTRSPNASKPVILKTSKRNPTQESAPGQYSIYRQQYLTIKQNILTGAMDEKMIHPHFKSIYYILKTLEDLDNDSEEAFEAAMADELEFMASTEGKAAKRSIDDEWDGLLDAKSRHQSNYLKTVMNS